MSSTPRIVLHNRETDALERLLRADFPDAGFRTCDSYAALPGMIAEYRPEIVYSVRFDGTPGFPREALIGSNGPAWIANGGVGTDHLGVWNPARTMVTNAAGVAADMMAEYVIGGFLYFTLDLPGFTADRAARSWRPRAMTPIKGKKLLIIGLGHTGRAIASRANAFGMEVVGTRARSKPVADVDEVHGAEKLHDLLPRADFITVTLPLTAATRGLIGPREFAVMKPGAVLADVSRGGIVNQCAMYDALTVGHLAGGIVDVFETEPLPQDSALWSADNLIITPHCSSAFDGSEENAFRLFLDNLHRRLRGEPLENIVDPVRGY